MTESEKYWIDVLHFFEKKGYVKYGLTIPFLVGVCKQKYGKNTNKDWLKEFLFSLKRLVESQKIKISYCSYLEEDVISIRVSKWLNDSKKIDDNAIADYIQKYSDKISKNLNSKIDDEWKTFSKLDLDRINEANINL